MNDTTDRTESPETDVPIAKYFPSVEEPKIWKLE